jgi:hypothetical protein
VNDLGKSTPFGWRSVVILSWLLISAYFLFVRWAQIHWFSLGDTDDNLRLMQVRAWLHGQGWFDLRQYRLNPPEGANIHWSRLVDLPLAGIILLFKPLIGGAKAEYVAIAIVPMIPMLVALMGLAVATRRLLSEWAFVIAIGVFIFCQGMMSMYMPTRIDHHGWQLAMLPWLIAGMADNNRTRGGVTIGVATALSLTIGLEMLPYLALAAGVLGFRWIFEAREDERLRAYGVALAGGTGLGYLFFASYANRIQRCDALSPVWLSVMLAAGGVMLLLSLVQSRNWKVRGVAASIGGAAIGLGFAYFWPQCLGKPEGISPELNDLWFSHIREVKPISEQSFEAIVALSFSAVIGVVGALFALVRAKGTERFGAWGGAFLLSACAGGLLLWQSRAGPAAQMLSIPGATALGWTVLPKLRASKSILVRVFGTFGAFALISGLAVQYGLILKPADKRSTSKSAAASANASCGTIPSLAPIARLPRGTMFTFVDLSPRLIVLTHHSAIAGPYHRNGDAILDVHHAFRGSAPDAEVIVRRHGSRYLLICPGSSESTIYKAETPTGFYTQLSRGQVPSWLKPIALPKRNPYMIWEVLPPSLSRGRP